MVSNACANWSGQEVDLNPQRMPLSLSMASFASMPSTSFEIPCKLPLHPCKRNRTDNAVIQMNVY